MTIFSNLRPFDDLMYTNLELRKFKNARIDGLKKFVSFEIAALYRTHLG